MSIGRDGEMKARKESKTDPPIFVGKWTCEILFSLNERPRRHGQLQRRLKRISQRMLTRTLRNLESARLISRGATGRDARVVECSLTELGRGFIAPLTSMCKWAQQHGKDVTAEVHLVEVHQKQGVHARL